MNVTMNGLTPDEGVALSRAIDNGLDPYKVNSRTAKIYAQQEIQKPGRKWNDLGATAAFDRNVSIQKSLDILDSIYPLLDELKNSHTDLGFTSYPLVNKGKRVYMEQTGDPRVTAYDNLRNNIILEVTNAMQGSSQMSDARVRMEQENLQKAASPQQMTAAIENIKKIIGARSKAFKENTRGSLSTSPSNQPAAAPKQTKPKTANDYLKKLNGGQ